MKERKALVFVLVSAALLFLGVTQNRAQAPINRASTIERLVKRAQMAKQRQAAADRRAATLAKTSIAGQQNQRAAAVPPPGGTPDYFGIYPNYANSRLPTLDSLGGVIPGTGIRKFVDSLPGLGAGNANNLGQYIPIATKMTDPSGHNDDYYEIGVFDYIRRMHSDLPPTTQLRGYKDLAPGASGQIQYLGPLIIAQRDKPVRIKFSNRLAPNSSYFLPVDTSVMGAGLGPQGSSGGNYSPNRATIHLHGGNTPWISDGTPHQWVAPAGESTPYTRGVSTQNVPDMPDPEPGAMTFYYPNQQSGRLMFYHDHAYGITRLNVYAGEAAGYLLVDSVEEGLINSGVLPNEGSVYRYGIPLLIQDKTFVPDSAALAAQDPTWNWGALGIFGFPMSICRTRTPMTIPESPRWAVGTMAPGFGLPLPA